MKLMATKMSQCECCFSMQSSLNKLSTTCSSETVKEVPQNMYTILGAAENIIIEVPQKIPMYAFSATLAFNGIYIIIY